MIVRSVIELTVLIAFLTWSASGYVHDTGVATFGPHSLLARSSDKWFKTECTTRMVTDPDFYGRKSKYEEMPYRSVEIRLYHEDGWGDRCNDLINRAISTNCVLVQPANDERSLVRTRWNDMYQFCLVGFHTLSSDLCALDALRCISGKAYVPRKCTPAYVYHRLWLI